ncbi:hypothetical protein M9458_041063, partial [Cirrhinus mrigala]
SRLFNQADVTSFSNFQRKTGRLPDTCGNDDLDLGIQKRSSTVMFLQGLVQSMFNSLFLTIPDGEVLLYCRTMETLNDFTLYSSGSSAVFLK